MKAFLFDLDGTIVDSEPLHFESEQRLLAEQGISFTLEQKNQYVGLSTEKIIQRLIEDLGLQGEVEELVAKKTDYYLELVREKLQVYPQMKPFITNLHAAGVPLAIASGSSLEIIHPVLAATKIQAFFSVITSAEEVDKGKPAPDVFLKAAHRLEVDPADCVVVEDSIYGVQAAQAAGMKCIAIPYLTQSASMDSFQKADLLFAKGMESFDHQKALAWFHEQASQ